MRHGASGRRSRNRGHGQGGQGGHNGQRRPTHNRNQIFDSNGPDVRIRGTAHQVCEKYLALAKDASSIGDSILAESYLQHAEHYQRIINTWADEFQHAPRPANAYVSADGGESATDGDDLSLPSSILGGEVKVEEGAEVRTPSYANQDELESV
ncbi:MAG: DUF4167 domain-containing protein [Micavibrio aeruginosavorus]|uniref:DUF4167 domain-containing protein n=1 Tax=Micavibrio aeruginosavorus TaxID=349221 RepID=A0A2W5A342_9BACT|nr:MAG: DUF4167 domain-containing protein [Micavibrio aeruginosavorus]